MSYKKDVIMQIRDEEKMKKMSKALAKKLEKMTPEKRAEFVDKLTKKLRILNAELKDLNIKENKLDDRYWKRDLSEGEASVIVGGSVLLFALASGIMIPVIFGEELVGLALALLPIPAIAGIGIGLLGCIMAENKVISNFIATIRQKLIACKQNKLNKEKDKINLQLDKTQEFV